MTKRVSIILTNWNGRQLLANCLESLFSKTTYPNYEVIIVDNGSIDGSAEFVKGWMPGVKVIQLDKNYGFSVASNAGIKAASGEYILILNNDTVIIQEDWINVLVDNLESDDSIGVVGCRQVATDGTYYPALEKLTVVGAGLTGNASLIKKSVLDKIGLFDEGFSPFLYEDTDLFARMTEQGYKVVHNPHAKILHNHSTTINKLDDDYIYYVCRKNRLRYTRLHMSKQLIVQAVISELKDIASAVLHPKRAVLYFKAWW